jgi:hypothetical protein
MQLRYTLCGSRTHVHTSCLPMSVTLSNCPRKSLVQVEEDKSLLSLHYFAALILVQVACSAIQVLIGKVSRSNPHSIVNLHRHSAELTVYIQQRRFIDLLVR